MPVSHRHLGEPFCFGLVTCCSVLNILTWSCTHFPIMFNVPLRNLDVLPHHSSILSVYQGPSSTWGPGPLHALICIKRRPMKNHKPEIKFGCVCHVHKTSPEPSKIQNLKLIMLKADITESQQGPFFQKTLTLTWTQEFEHVQAGQDVQTYSTGGPLRLWPCQRLFGAAPEFPDMPWTRDF